jgi:hypothetical protein
MKKKEIPARSFRLIRGITHTHTHTHTRNIKEEAKNLYLSLIFLKVTNFKAGTDKEDESY